MDPTDGIYIGDRSKCLPAVYSVDREVPLFQCGDHKRVYKLTRADTAEVVACTKISKAWLEQQHSLKDLQEVSSQHYDVLLLFKLRHHTVDMCAF